MSVNGRLVTAASVIGDVNENQVNQFIKHFNGLFKTLESAFVNSHSAPAQGPTWSVPVSGKANLATYRVLRDMCRNAGWKVVPGTVDNEMSIFIIKQA